MFIPVLDEEGDETTNCYCIVLVNERKPPIATEIATDYLNL